MRNKPCELWHWQDRHQRGNVGAHKHSKNMCHAEWHTQPNESILLPLIISTIMIISIIIILVLVWIIKNTLNDTGEGLSSLHRSQAYDALSATINSLAMKYAKSTRTSRCKHCKRWDSTPSRWSGHHDDTSMTSITMIDIPGKQAPDYRQRVA